MPDSIIDERGRVVDIITDMHQYFHGKRVALFGDPDQLVAMTEFLVDLDMVPIYIITGTPGKNFDERISAVLGDLADQVIFKQGFGADQFYLHQLIKNDRPDLLIGTTHGKYSPATRIFRSFGSVSRSSTAAATPTSPPSATVADMRLLEKMLDLFLDRKDRDAPEEKFELVL